MPSISIRLSEDEFNKIDEYRQNESKAEFFRHVIEFYIEYHEGKMNSNESKLNADESKILQVYEKELDHLKQENLRLLELLNQAQILQLQAQQKLLPEKSTKSWWQFWKK